MDPFKERPVPTEGEALSHMAGAAPMLGSWPKKPAQELTEADIYYNEVDKAGNVIKYKKESGVPVKVADLGNIKDIFNKAIMKASMMSPADIAVVDFSDMTHIEIAAIKLAVFAAAGDLKAMQELFDRILGKAKQVSESTNLNLTIDDILNGVQAKKAEGDVIDV